MYTVTFRYVLRFASDADLAAQITADTFAAFLEKAQDVTNARSYLFQTAHNRAIDHYRVTRREAPLEVAMNMPDGGSFRPVEEMVEFRLSIEERRTAAKEALWLAEQILAPREYRAIILHFIWGYSLERTGEMIGVLEGNAKVIVYRAIEKLTPTAAALQGTRVAKKRKGNNILDAQRTRK